MSVLKPLGPTDVTLQKREVNKNWEISSSAFQDLRISVDDFEKPSEETLLTLSTPTGTLYHSVKHLYYSNFLNEDNIASGSFENYIQTSLFKNERELIDNGEVLSIPKQVYGEFIKPNSFKLITDNSTEYIDDGNGKIVNGSSEEVVGDIIYTHGIIVLRNDITVDSLEFKNSLTLKTLRVTAKVESAEFNFTSNPSALSLEKEEGVIAQSGGEIRDPKLSPYMTTVGLYNDRDELLAVAKVPQPVPISSDIETTFEIEIDL